MIYLVSRNKTLFGSTKYKEVSFEEAMKILLPLSLVQFDTETKGLDAHTKELLTVQLGCKENQVVFDWTTMSAEEKAEVKNYFESDRVFLGWNLMFDLGNVDEIDVSQLHKMGFSVREIEKLKGESKSSVSRKLNE